MSSSVSASLLRKVLNRLADARLVPCRRRQPRSLHEALIREWPTLREWLNQDREGLRLHRDLTEAAQDWLEMNREADMLYRGARLAQARRNGPPPYAGYEYAGIRIPASLPRLG